MNRSSIEIFLQEIADSFDVDILIILIKDKISFLNRKKNWCLVKQNINDELYSSYIKKLENFLDILENMKNKNYILDKKICQNFKRICEEKNLNCENLAKKSYFTEAQLFDFFEGQGHLYDTTDLEHLIELLNCREILEMTR